MDVSDVALLIGAVNGAIGAVALIVTPIAVAIINRGKDKPKVAQGQPVDHLGTLITDLTEARDYWRERADRESAARIAVERRLSVANQVLTANDLPTH